MAPSSPENRWKSDPQITTAAGRTITFPARAGPESGTSSSTISPGDLVTAASTCSPSHPVLVCGALVLLLVACMAADKSGRPNRTTGCPANMWCLGGDFHGLRTGTSDAVPK